MKRSRCKWTRRMRNTRRKRMRKIGTGEQEANGIRGHKINRNRRMKRMSKRGKNTERKGRNERKEIGKMRRSSRKKRQTDEEFR